MKKILFLVSLLTSTMAFASGDIHLDKAPTNLSDQQSLQRGAKTFVNYCLSCHSASYMRYNRVAADLGISEPLMLQNMVFIPDAKGDLKIGALMKSNMPVDVAKAAFNTVPPDLSLEARARGPEWFYTYMRSFYRDDKRPSGWNNIVFPNVAMPHVLQELQGTQRAVYRTEKSEMIVEQGGKKVKKQIEEQIFDHFDIDKAGSMTAEQYNDAMRDLTNFMVYLGEPAKLVRYRLGISVLVFLAIFFVVAYLLKKEYWKDVH